MISSQVLIFAISALFRAVQQHMANKQENRAKELEFMLKTDEMEHEGRQTVRQLIASNPLFSFTTSILAVMAFVLIIGAPVMAAFAGVPVYYGYVEIVEGWSFLGLFGGSGGQDMLFQLLPGIAILPYQTHLIAAIAGLYFGALKRQRR